MNLIIIWKFEIEKQRLPRMLCCFLFLVGISRAEFSRSKDLQRDISSKYFSPRDLQKVKLVDLNWIATEKDLRFSKISEGLLEHNDSKEIFFKSSQNSWTQKEIIETFPWDHAGFQRLIEKRLWNRIFYYTIVKNFNWCAAPEFLRALAEIVDVNEPQEDDRTSLHLATSYGDIDLLKSLLKRPGADPNLRTSTGDTTLHQALYWNMAEPVPSQRAKFSRNCKEFYRLARGFTPKQIYEKTDIQKKQKKLLELLFAHGATVAETDSKLKAKLRILYFIRD